MKSSKTMTTVVLMLILAFVLIGSSVMFRRSHPNHLAQQVFQGMVADNRIIHARKLEGGSEPRFGCVVLHDSKEDAMRICQALGLTKTEEDQMRRVALDYVHHGWPDESKELSEAQVLVGTLKRPPYIFVYAVLGRTNSYFIF